ncbi:MAG: uncharacterized protein KVP18_003839 [Porospora cf. gigantea A]|uniref:uncharacterized protein n=1 Tax=Porospora cf. gigantea A TaxID=2853593 RepID=UPI003559C489|nr:MAG: hypothetical protein KVP18_003839 [Porospora cf. gigantea A]
MLTLGSFDVKSEAFVAFATSDGPLVLETNHLASLGAAHAKFVKSTYDLPVKRDAVGGDEVPPALFRLLVALRLASLMDAKACVRPVILESLAELASNPTPSHGVCLGMSDDQACRALLCSLQTDLFSQDELCVLTSGSPFTGAQALLSLHHIRQLEALQVAAVSLSMLALDAPGTALQEDPAEQFSPLKQSIGRVKFIVEGSKTPKTDVSTWAHHLQAVACMVPLVESLERACLSVYKKQCLKPDKRNPLPMPASRLLDTTMTSVKVALSSAADCTAERCTRLLNRCAHATCRPVPSNPLPEAPDTLNPCKDVDKDFLTTCDGNHLLTAVLHLLEVTLGEIRTARVVLADQDAAAYW